MGGRKSENREYRSKDENQQQTEPKCTVGSRNGIQRLEESVKVENKKKF